MRTASTIAIAALVAAAACSHEEKVVAEPPTAVETVAAAAMRHESGVRYSATVKADAEATLAFRVSGYVERLAADEGDFVRRGAVLAEIRTSDAREHLAQAAAGHAEARANLAQAKEDYDRARSLYDARSMTKPELDAAEARYAAAVARLSSAKSGVSEGKIGLADTRLVAPFDGVVIDRRVERGDLAGPSNAAFVVADIRRVKVELAVPDTTVGKLAMGQTVNVRTESRPGVTYPARITRIAPAADSRSRAFPVELTIDNVRGELKPGMVASLEIGGAPPAPALAVPLSAVVRGPRSHEGYAVFVVENGAAHARTVDLGDPVGNLVIVDGGLAAGEKVVVSGPALLVDGQKVRETSRRQS